MQRLHEMLLELDDARRGKLLSFHQRNADLIHSMPGATHNHQAWQGGYADHIAETFRIANKLHASMSEYRPLPFSLESALVVLYFHDIEKLWRDRKLDFDAKVKLLADEYQIELAASELNALEFIHGEGDAYSSKRRTMEPLAAFCHVVDTISARIWFEHERSTSEQLLADLIASKQLTKATPERDRSPIA